jgi:hypothetical protein
MGRGFKEHDVLAGAALECLYLYDDNTPTAAFVWVLKIIRKRQYCPVFSGWK